MSQANANHPMIQKMFSQMPLAEAGELHERLLDGRTDSDTRQRLQNALRQSGLHRAEGWQ